MLVNLAQVYSKRGNNTKAEELLRKSLQLDPNQENGLQWLVEIDNQKGGRAAIIKGLRKLAEIKGSWRPQMWLAKDALERKSLEDAVQYYKHVISLAKDEPEVLKEISGELGFNGYHEAIFELVVPVYDPVKHNVFAGLNILRSYLKSNRYKEGRLFLKKMVALNRPDIKDQLSEFDVKFNADGHK